jgi:hypothetical protein
MSSLRHDWRSVQAFPARYSLNAAAHMTLFPPFSGSSFPGYSPGLFPSLFWLYLQNSSIIGGIESFSSGVPGGHLAEFFLSKGTGLPLLITHSVYSIASASILTRSPPLDF